MRIVLSNASPAWGGVHRVTEILAAGLQARGHTVRVFCRPRSRLEARLQGTAPLDPVLWGMDFHPGSLWAVRGALRRFRPDVVMALTHKDVRLTAPVARALGVPTVVRHANDQPIRPGPYGRLLYGLLPALHVTNAAATRRTILASAPWLAPARVEVVYNGVDLEGIEKAEPADLGFPEGALAIGFVGAFRGRKGLLELAAAWPEVAAASPEAHLVLVGAGPDERPLRERLGGSDRVHFLGYRDDGAAVIRALDVLVLPSRVEGAPNVVLEAMAASRPVVATAVSGTPELVEDGVTGLLVPARSPGPLARALITLAADASLRERMGAAGRERVRDRFTLTGMLDRYETLLASAAGGTHG